MTNKVMYFHGHTTDNTRFTISGIVKNNKLFMGVAICSNVDHFVKEKGRIISASRLQSDKESVCGRIALGAPGIDGIENKVFNAEASKYNKCDLLTLKSVFNCKPYAKASKSSK